MTNSEPGSTPSKIVISVDLDMWWHCRWATGGPISRWGSIDEMLNEYYIGQDPYEEFRRYVDLAIDILDKHNCSATFFILGDVAEKLKTSVKQIHDAGHEVASHGWHHVDSTTFTRDEFRAHIRRSKELLEDITGSAVNGYRAPNLVLTPWLFDEVYNAGFTYDSSICPSRPFGGKYKGLAKYPNRPFCLPIFGELSNSNARLVEIPVTTMPFLRLPACSSIITRVVGLWWTRFAIRSSLRKGNVLYYFHPYELGEPPKLERASRHIRRFLKNIGSPFEKMLTKLLIDAERIGTILAKEAAWEIQREKN